MNVSLCITLRNADSLHAVVLVHSISNLRHLVFTQDLHRLYWAIRSNRNKVAEVLLHRCKQPIVAGLFAAKLYSEHKLPRNHVPDVTQKARFMPSEMRLRCEQYAVSVLNHANLDQTTAAFDEYMFYSTKMEGTAVFKEFLNTQQAVIDNESIRDALTLIDVSPEQPVTRIDLALMCNAKAFLNQPGVAHFLDRLWKRPSENGQYVQWMASYYISPRHKGVINMAGFLSMLMVVMSFISSLPERGDSIELFGALEVTFWVWTLAYVYNELEQFTTLHEYIETVENCIDALIVCMFVLAFVARGVHFAEVQNWIDGSRSLEALVVLLCINLLFCWMRFLVLLKMHEQVGTMLIVFGKILQKDVVPFLMFSAVIVVAFESSVQFISWLLDVDHQFGTFLLMFGSPGHFSTIDTDPELPWDSGNPNMEWNVTIAQFSFFLVMNVILMNLLIAMMADTYTNITTNAEAEYQMQKAQIIKEMYSDTVLPVPLNILEHAVNRLMAGRMDRLPHDKHALQWGKHYTWPASKLANQLTMAMKIVAVSEQTRKVRQKGGVANVGDDHS